MNTALEQARQHFLDGIGYFEAGRLEPARASFEASLALAPGRASVLANLGITLFRLRLWQDAVPVLQQAVAADPAQTEAWFALGLCHEAQAQWADAADALAQGPGTRSGAGRPVAGLRPMPGECRSDGGRVACL